MAARRIFLLLYLLSGAAALLYEVAWSRLLTLYMGHTVGAVGTVLAAFMGGLAVGAGVGGRVAPSLRRYRALRVYAGLELTIAACALLLPLALSVAHPVLAWAYRNGEGGRLFGLTRVVLSLLLLSVPTAAMGATYPVAVRWLATRAQVAAARASHLYAANTAGAATGAALAGFVLLPTFGLRGTILTGVALNVAGACGALLLAARMPVLVEAEVVNEVASAPRSSSLRTHHRSGRARGNSSCSEARSGSLERPAIALDASVPLPGRTRLAAVALGVSGFVALVYEVAWTRIIGLVLGPTTYAFSAMLVAFVAGLGIGSTLAAALLLRIRRPGAWLGIAMAAAAVAALILCWHIDRLPLSIAAVVARPDVRVTSVLTLQTVLVIALMLPMTTALGATFPLAIGLATCGAERAPRDVATVYATNTVGAIAGALAASFLFIPVLGLQTTVRAAGLLATGTGVTVALLSSDAWADRIVAVTAATMAILVAAFMPSWNRALLSSGAYRYASGLNDADFESVLEAGRLLYYREGAAGTVSVKQRVGIRSLVIDGKVDASNGADMLTQKLLAHLPLLLHRHPRTVCVIGLGSGVTLGAALRHPIARADVVEISPEVVAASGYFAIENHGALRDRRTRLIVGDGRSHLLLSSTRYDVIISEPSNPWLAGMAPLFTREIFQAARERLMPGGILCQWAHTYSISDEDLRSIVATFLAVFPDGYAWLIGDADLLLIGSTGPLEALDRGLVDAWTRPGVSADLAAVGVRDPFSLLTSFIAGGHDLARYAGKAPVQTDDRLSLEFSAPHAIYGRFQHSNVARLWEVAARSARPRAVITALAAATPAEWRNRGLMRLQAGAYELAYDDFRQAVTAAPGDVTALDGLVRAAIGARRARDAAGFLTRLTATARTVSVLLGLSKILDSLGEARGAVEAAQQARAMQPSNPLALEQLALLYAEQGDVGALEPVVQALEHTIPDQPEALYGRASLELLRGDFSRAAEIAERLVSLDRASARALSLLGGAYGLLGETDRARRAFEASLRLNPRDPAVLVNLGTLELRSANPRAAAEHFAEVLSLYPTLTPALRGLADALEQQGHAARAARIRESLPAG